MFDFLSKDTPPREVNRERDLESREAVDTAFHTLMRQMLRRMEECADDERTRARAGLARRHSDVDEAIKGMLRFSDPRRPVPIDTIKAASAVMDQVMTELTAFLKDNTLPEKESSKIEEI